MPLSRINTNAIENNAVTAGKVAAAQVIPAVGIQFPATQVPSADANTLDDYEEGTWTPGINLLGTVSYGNLNGRYQRIGRYVTVMFSMSVSSTNTTQDSAAMQITSLPFTSANIASNYGFGSSSIQTENMRGFQSPTAPNTFHVMVNPNDTTMQIIQNNYNSTISNKSWFGSNRRDAYNGDTLYIIGRMTYFTSD